MKWSHKRLNILIFDIYGGSLCYCGAIREEEFNIRYLWKKLVSLLPIDEVDPSKKNINIRYLWKELVSWPSLDEMEP